MANFTVYLSPIEPTTIESKTVSSAFTQEDGKITIPMLPSSVGNSNINIEIALRKTADNYIFAVFDPGSPYISWERTYYQNGENIHPSSSITISFKLPGNDRIAFPYWTSTVISAKNPDKILEHSPFILERSWAPGITLGEIPESSSDIWNKSYEIEEEHIETQPIVRPGEYLTVKWYMYVDGKSFNTSSIVIPYETPLFTGGWITAKMGEGVDVKYSVEVYGSVIDGIMPTDFYDYQVGKWVYLMKNVNLTLDPDKDNKQMYGSSNIEEPNSTLGELEAAVSDATERDLAAKDAVINPIPPNEQQINTAGGMAAAIAAIAAAAIVEAAAAAAALIAAETALENYDPTEEVNTEYRIVPFNFKGPMNIDCAVPYQDAIDLDSATNFEEVFDMIKYEGTITSINNNNDTAIVNILGIGDMTLPIFYYCDGTEPSIEGGSAAFSEDDLVVIETPNNDWNEAKIIGFPNEVKECSFQGVFGYIELVVTGQTTIGIIIDMGTQSIFPLIDPITGEELVQPFNITDKASILLENNLVSVSKVSFSTKSSTTTTTSTQVGSHTGPTIDAYYDPPDQQSYLIWTKLESWDGYGDHVETIENWSGVGDQLKTISDVALKTGSDYYYYIKSNDNWIYQEHTLSYTITSNTDTNYREYYYDYGIPAIELVSNYVNSNPIKIHEYYESVSTHYLHTTWPGGEYTNTSSSEASLVLTVYSVDGTSEDVEVDSSQSHNVLKYYDQYIYYYPSIDMSLFYEYNYVSVEPTDLSSPKIYYRKQSIVYSYANYAIDPPPNPILKTISESKLYSLFGATKTLDSSIRYSDILIPL